MLENSGPVAFLPGIPAPGGVGIPAPGTGFSAAAGVVVGSAAAGVVAGFLPSPGLYVEWPVRF